MYRPKSKGGISRLEDRRRIVMSSMGLFSVWNKYPTDWWCFSQHCNQPFWRSGYSSKGWCRIETCQSDHETRDGSGSSRVGLRATGRCCCVAMTCWSRSCLAKGCRQAGVAVSKVDVQPEFAVAKDVKHRHQDSP